MILVQVWSLAALAWATPLPFLFNGTEIGISSVDVVETDHATGLYNVTVSASNANETIEDINDGYFTTLRSFVIRGRDRSTTKHTEEHGVPFCSTIRGGCPVAPNTNFTFSFNASLGSGLSYLDSAQLHVEVAEMHRFLGTLELRLTREMSFSVKYGVGVFVPLIVIFMSIVKYFVVLWLDPEPVSNWNPLACRASGADELAAIGSISQVMRQLQLIAFTAIVDVQYPAYYQSLFAKMGWAIGIIPNNWVSGLEAPSTADDGLASLAGASQLESLMYFAGVPTVADLWPVNAVVWLCMIIIVGIFSFLIKRKSRYRWLHACSNMLFYWFSVLSLPMLFIIFTSLIYFAKTRLNNTDFYITSGMKMYSLSKTLPFAFELNKRFYTTTISPGLVFSMALYMALWVGATIFAFCVVIKARKAHGYTRSNLVLWGSYFHSSKADIWYQLLEVLLVAVQASIFSFLSKSPLIQVILLVSCQLAQLASAYGTRPQELSAVGFCLMLIPKILAIASCCLLIPLVPIVVKTYPNLLEQVCINRVVLTVVIVHGFTLFYFLCLHIFCICTTIWRHFKLQPSHRVKAIPSTDNTEYVGTDVYYRPPRNQPDPNVSELEEEDISGKNYAIREVDFVYGINGAKLGQEHPIPLSPHSTHEKPKFVDKLFKPKASPTGFEVMRYPMPRSSSASDVPMLAGGTGAGSSSSSGASDDGSDPSPPKPSRNWRKWQRNDSPDSSFGL